MIAMVALPGRLPPFGVYALGKVAASLRTEMGSLGDTLLDRLRRGDRATSPVALLLDDPQALEQALEPQPDELLAAVEANVAQASGSHVALVGESFASAACNGPGRLVAFDTRLRDWLGEGELLESVIREAAGGHACLTVVAEDGRGRPVALAAARWPLACRWPLSEAVAAALRAGTASHAVVAFCPGANGWVRAGKAFGLTQAELRVAEALARYADLRRTCKALGIAYETGRKLLAAMMRKVGAKRQAEALNALLAVAAGDAGGGCGATCRACWPICSC